MNKPFIALYALAAFCTGGNAFSQSQSTAVPVSSTTFSPVGTAAPASVTLEWCRTATRENYPALSKLSLIDQSEKLSLAAANTAMLPRLTLSGKYTDQSDVTKISLPASMASLNIPSADTDQYQLAAEVSQTLWDGGLTAAKKNSVRAASGADRTKLETSLYSLRSRVNAAYFGILLVNSQLEQNAILREELAANHRRVTAWVANGVATQSDLDAVQVEELNAEQLGISLKSTRASLLDTLSLLTGAEFSGSEQFARPETAAAADTPLADGIARPETAWFAALEKMSDSQKSQLVAQAMPRLSAFAQAGYGKPGLNMLNSDPAIFWIAGVRFSWSVDGFWSLPFTLAKVNTDTASIAADRETFYRTVAIEAAGKREEIRKLEALVNADSLLVELRTRMKNAAKTKLDNGTIGTVDYLRDINAESLARQGKALHETQLLEARFALRDTLNQ